MLVDLLFGFIDGHGTEVTGIARGHLVLALQVSSHVVLFVRDMGSTELARVFAFTGPLGVRLYHV